MILENNSPVEDLLREGSRSLSSSVAVELRLRKILKPTIDVEKRGIVSTDRHRLESDVAVSTESKSRCPLESSFAERSALGAVAAALLSRRLDVEASSVCVQ